MRAQWPYSQRQYPALCIFRRRCHLGCRAVKMVAAQVRRGLMLAGLLIQFACQPAAAPEKDIPTRYESGERPQVARLAAAGTIRLGRILAVATKIEDATPFGETVSLSIQNMTDKPQAVRIDCGTVLRA